MLLHPRVVTSVADCQLGDIEAKQQKQNTAFYNDSNSNKKISIGDNKQLTTEFRKESERRKRETEAPKPDGIMRRERRKQEYKEGVGLSD